MEAKRAIIYTRQSLDRNGEGLAVARQREDCVKLCRDRGWTVVPDRVTGKDVFDDNDISPSNGKPRPGFERVLRMVDQRAVDVVVVWAVDRLVRKLADLEDVIEGCERSGVKLATVSGDIDLSTDAGRLVGRILASVARNEIERKSARQRRAYLQRAEAGKPTKFSHRSFGYAEDRITKVPAEADAVADACEHLLSGGTVRSVVKKWNEAGLTSAQGGRTITHQSVVTILRNPRIAALSTYQGEIVGTGNWPELVPEPTWRAVRALLDDPNRGRRTRGVRSMLGGLVRCQCGMKACSSTNSRGQHVYRCDRLRLPGSSGHVARLSEPVDDYVTELVIERLSRDDAVDLLIDHDRPDVEELRKSARTLRARIEELGAEFASGALPASQLRVINDSIAAKLTAIEMEIADAGQVSVLGDLVGATDVRAVWDGLDLDRRRAVIDALMVVTLYSPGKGARVFDPATVKITPGRSAKQPS